MPEGTFLIFACGPIVGLTFDSANNWRRQLIKEVASWKGVRARVLSPLRGRENLRQCGILKRDGSYLTGGLNNSPRAAAVRDELDVRRCDLVFANLLGATETSLMSLGEMCLARALGKKIIALMEIDNVNHHPVMDEWWDLIVPDFSSGLELLKQLVVP